MKSVLCIVLGILIAALGALSFKLYRCLKWIIVAVRGDVGLDAVYEDLAKKVYDVCLAEAKDKPMRRACGILQEVVWDCWNGHVR